MFDWYSDQSKKTTVCVYKYRIVKRIGLLKTYLITLSNKSFIPYPDRFHCFD